MGGYLLGALERGLSHNHILTSDKLNNPTNNTHFLIIIKNIGVILWIIRISQGSGQGPNDISSS